MVEEAVTERGSNNVPGFRGTPYGSGEQIRFPTLCARKFYFALLTRVEDFDEHCDLSTTGVAAPLLALQQPRCTFCSSEGELVV